MKNKRHKYTRAKNDFEDWLLKLIRCKIKHSIKESSAFKVYVEILPNNHKKYKIRTITGWEYLDLNEFTQRNKELQSRIEA